MELRGTISEIPKYSKSIFARFFIVNNKPKLARNEAKTKVAPWDWMFAIWTLSFSLSTVLLY